MLYILAYMLLAFSAVGINLISNKISFLSGKEMFLFNYQSPLVIVEGLFLFCLFLSLEKNKEKAKIPTKLLAMITKSSLMVYMLHMHPVWKNIYVKYRVLEYVQCDNFLYFAYILVSALLLLVLITILAYYIFIPISNKLEIAGMRIYLKLKKSKE